MDTQAQKNKQTQLKYLSTKTTFYEPQFDEISQRGELQSRPDLKHAWNNDVVSLLTQVYVCYMMCVCVTVCVLLMCVSITLCIPPKDFFYLLLCLKQPAVLLQSSPSFNPKPQPASLLVLLLEWEKNLSLESIESSFSFTSFIFLHLWAHSLEGKGPRLMGPSPRRDFFSPPFLPLIFSPVFFTGRICDEGKE